MRANDPDDTQLDVTFHAAARGTGEPGAGGAPFTFLTLPDTQNYVITPTYTANMTGQLQWIADQRASLNLAFMTGLGDIVDNHTSTAQWTRATTNMAILDQAGVPNMVIPGNHDFDNATGAYAGYDTYFPVSRYRDAAWNSPTASYGGYYGQNQYGPDGGDRQNMNNFSLFSAGGMDFIVIGLELNPPDAVLAWADRVLDAHPTRRAIITTHSYVNVPGALSNQVLRTDIVGNGGAQIFQKLVYPNCNVFMVVNGHFTDGLNGESRRTDTNSCGTSVFGILTDFQGRPAGGDGWLRYYTFTPSENTITATTYSPTLNQYETDANSAFTLSYDMAPPADLPVIGTRSVAAGATASVPLPDVAEGTVVDWYATVSDGTSTTRGPTWSTTVETTPVVTELAADSFGRTVTSGWGTSETGGAWAVNSAAKLSVAGGVGRISANAGSTLTATLPTLAGTATDVRASFALDRLPNQYINVSVAPRQVSASGYAVRVRVNPNGSVVLQNMRDNTVLSGGTVAGLTVSAAAKVRTRVQVEGTNPTTIRSRIWLDGTPEPAAWHSTATDPTAALQQPGSLRLTAYLTSAATNGPVIVSFDDLTAVPIGAAPPTNAPPTAAFTWTADGLTVTADSTTSTDTDGTIASRTWSFDGTAATGVTGSRTFPASGTYPVTLTVTDDDGATATITKNVTVTAPAVNAPPTAAFTWTADGLTITADSTTSTDTDGTIASRTWSFDGTAATGVTASRTFPASGTYPVTLTVTDDDDATATITKNVTVTAPPTSTNLAEDAFTRTAASGWGTADRGGAWTVNSTAKMTVSGGAGRVAANAGSTLNATLGAVSSTSVDARVSVTLDRVPNQYINVGLSPRVVGTAMYGARVRVNPNGSVALNIVRDATTLAGNTIPSLTLTAGAKLNVRVQVQGTAPTTIRTRVWLEGTAEPASWQYTATDATAALQAPGSPRLTTYLTSAATNGPVTVAYDDLVVTPLP